MQFRNKRIPRGYVVLEDITKAKTKPGRSYLFWLAALSTLFSIFIFSELAEALPAPKQETCQQTGAYPKSSTLTTDFP